MGRSRAPDRRSRLVVGDVVRGLAASSLLVAATQWGLVGAALFLLVLGGTILPRVLGAPDALDVACCSTLLFAAWAAQLDWYVAVSWLDVVVHAAATGLLAIVAWLLVARRDPEAGMFGSLGTSVLVVGAGAALAILWELGEWFGHTYLDGRIQVGYEDTMGDLAAGVLGSVLAAVLVVRAPRSVWARRFAEREQ